MAAQKGKDVLIKINTTGSTYVTLGGLRSSSITFSDEAVDIMKKKRGQVDNGRRSKRNRHMAFVPTIQGMGYILRISVHFKKSENTIRKKTVWRRVV